MFSVLIFTSLLLALASCKPDHLVAPAVVTAQSSQYFVRNHNALYGPIIAEAPIVAAEPAGHLVAEPVFKTAPHIAAQFVRTEPIFRAAPLVAQETPVLRTAPFLAKAPLVLEPKPVLRTAPLVAEGPFVAEAPLVAEHLGAIFRSAPLIAEAEPALPEHTLAAEHLLKKNDRLVQAGPKSAPYKTAPLMNKEENAERSSKNYQPSQPRPSAKKVNTEPLVETFGQQATKPEGENFGRLEKAPAEAAVVDAPFHTSSLYTHYYPGYSYYV